ncbi:MAG: LysR family transcriptional regulator [Gammaproteobacteria bacterium]|nr:MAG: LysR family transcriptional regulator [Gammaproteobacteria bacterium]
MNNLNDMAIFAKVAEFQGISPAARALRMPKSKVSRRMAALEAELGVRLLERSTRAVHLTEVGEIFFQSCKRIVEEAEGARESVIQMLEIPRGRLRVNASVAIGQHLLAPFLGEFMALYPEIELEMQLENRRVDLIHEGYDVVIRLGKLEDSTLVSKVLGEDRAILVASPNYIKQMGMPKQLGDLKNHRFLVMGDTHNFDHWALTDINDRQETFDVSQYQYTNLNDLTMIRQVAIDGGGIALMPRYLCTDDVMKSGKLCQILSDWRTPTFRFYALYPSHRSMTIKLRAWLDFFSNKLNMHK